LKINFGETTYAQVMADNRHMRASARSKPYRIVVLSNVLVSPLPPLLEWMFLNSGIPVEIAQATFDNIVQESASVGNADAAIVFWDIAGISVIMPANLAADEQKFRVFYDGLSANVGQVLRNLKDVPLVVFNSFSALPFESEMLRPGILGRIADELNRTLNTQLSSNVVRVNLDKVYAIAGLKNALDFRQAHSARAIHTIGFFKSWVEHAYPAFRSAAGRARKVLVMDCDNTLWGGIIGEDGIDGIRLDETTPDGPFFREAQRIVKDWKSEGILLAIASRNNPEDVKAALTSHPEMQLREEDFVALEVGWSEKIDGLRRIASNLNLGIDSLVFVDDSPFELERVKTSLPEVICLQVPKPVSDFPRLLRNASGLFFNLSKSEEDTRRTEMYREDMVRKDAMAQFESLDAYLASLQVEVGFSEGNAVNLARAAQMSQKTNQFNLTTKRYTEGDLERMVRDPQKIVATFSVRDRFGDYGTTGLLIVNLSPKDRTATLDTFLMSCRVLGRKVEETVLEWLRGRLARVSYKRLDGEYLRTSKNSQVSDLLDRLGFTRTSAAEGRTFYALELPS
jgi:FkbH-like protein